MSGGKDRVPAHLRNLAPSIEAPELSPERRDPAGVPGVSALDNRPTAHYPGDVRAALGQVVGPNTSGELLVIDEVTFDTEADKSTAPFRYATEAEARAATRI